jgi:hypothetical protein
MAVWPLAQCAVAVMVLFAVSLAPITSTMLPPFETGRAAGPCGPAAPVSPFDVAGPPDARVALGARRAGASSYE